MRNPVPIQDIEAMRREAGIDDVELRTRVRQLKAGDLVKLTLLSAQKAGESETVWVSITSVAGGIFHGTLNKRPTATTLKQLAAGTPLAFQATHIHSVKPTSAVPT